MFDCDYRQRKVYQGVYVDFRKLNRRNVLVALRSIKNVQHKQVFLYSPRFLYVSEASNREG
jgi:hypothetical protein